MRPASNGCPTPGRLLTPQELQIAKMAAEGMSNREIGQRLFLSHRTVGSHLYRLFPKLGVTSRVQLSSVDRQAFHILTCQLSAAAFQFRFSCSHAPAGRRDVPVGPTADITLIPMPRARLPTRGDQQHHRRHQEDQGIQAE